MTSPDSLALDRAHLEAEIAGLKSKLDRATARLDGLRESPEPRGFVPGVFAGGLVVAAGVVWFFVLVASVLGHD